ncbi:MAG TPA: Crp/Fnr family transcriptional regulator [Bacteroidia bacterium]
MNLAYCEDHKISNPLIDQHCTSEEKLLIQNNSHTHDFRKGDIIFFDFQPATYVHLILNGKVKLWKEGIHTHHMITSFAKNGDMIGNRGCMKNSNYLLSASAIENTKICLIHKDIFSKILDQNKKLHSEILNNYINNLEITERRLRNIAEMNVREKTADAILFLLDKFGFEKDSQTLNIKLSREDLASIAGISTDRVVKQIGEFENDNLIAAQGQNIMIKNLKNLNEIISLYACRILLILLPNIL